MTTDSDVFYGYVLDGQNYPPQRVEQATRAMQRQLSSRELRRINDALLRRLDDAKEAYGALPKRRLLADPAVSTLVNTLALVNAAWITTVIAKNIKRRPCRHGTSTEELYSTALTGAGDVGGVMNAILEYDYRTAGVASFSPYLARAIANALQPTRKQDRTYRRVQTRTRPLHKQDEEGTEPGWVDRRTPPPEAVAINRDLLEVVKSVIHRLPTAHQRLTAAWMIDRILTTGELPMAREAADCQRPRVSRERGRQIMEATVDSIRQQIEADYPQLAAQGLNGWESFKAAFSRTRAAAQQDDMASRRGGKGI